MRTLALLAALLLLALQAQAEPLPENNEEAPDQEQPGEEDQDMTVSFAGPEAPGLQRSRILKCHCSSRGCNQRLGEHNRGSCFQGGKVYKFCCRRI
uniref:Alpha-defensin N-terminal domain-containing protein n=1 Tax=Marmota marmota marmota TaxID=9994 RepID=A0A8C6A9X2_MARMA